MPLNQDAAHRALARTRHICGLWHQAVCNGCDLMLMPCRLCFAFHELLVIFISHFTQGTTDSGILIFAQVR